MRTMIILATAGLLSLGTAAFAQDAGSPGATGTGGGLSGSNTGTGGATSMSGHRMGMGMHHRHAMRHMRRMHRMAMQKNAPMGNDSTGGAMQGDQSGQMK